VNLPPELETTLNRILGWTVEQEQIPEEAEVSLLLVDDETIQTWNREYRNIDRITDVLSFAIQESGEEEPELRGGPVETLLLGDIVISAAAARRQAVEYGHSLERELCYLAVHGMLHLLGYDHVEAEEQSLMRQREEEILAHFGLDRKP